MNNIEELRATLNDLYKRNNKDEIEHFFNEKISPLIPDCCSMSEEYVFLMNEAGSYYRGISDYKKSISMYSMLSNDMLRFGMGDSIEFATMTNNMAGAFRMSGQVETADTLANQALQLFVLNNDTESFEYVSVLNNLSLCYNAKQNYDSALKYQLEAISILKKDEKANPITLATSYSNLANIYISLKDTDSAESMTKRALKIFEESENTSSPYYIGALHTLGFINYAKKEYKQAQEIYEKSMELLKNKFGENADYATAEKNLAYTMIKQNESEKAAALLKDVLRIEKDIFGEEHPRYIDTKNLIKETENKNNEQ